ncbi:MAG: NnrU family protein [Rhodospirillaceae bacterium]|nr:NnrU family protein [Rhodospirillaceae bacterium]MBT5193713.1 NnrU family protein [Rhodospirillaceae bacterium]MBT5894623.1 NnrU family protein [Rhodospirillaceae bacterium]MBT6429227.1 NnrU family protein [Rhodospirillaceae bacterium]MBT7757069.1 NnrU family protein [Rhodospirillaceae bacterium]
MVSLLLASLLFVGIHAVISGTGLRAVIVGKIGQGPYMALFSLLSAGALFWCILAYAAAPHVELWADVTALKMLAIPLMLVAIVLAALASSTPNPTATGGEKALRDEQSARGIIKVTRHPFLVGVTIWSIAHILANGDLASVIMFGGFLALSLIGPLQIDAKRAAKYPDTWPHFIQQTSWLPFAAIIQGRNKVTLNEIGWGRIGGGVALFLVILLLGHEWAIGVSVLPLG